MTQPVALTAGIAPFTQAALDAALPPKAAPQAGTEAPPAPAAETPDAASTPAAAPPPAGAPTTLERAQAAAAALVAKRTAQRSKQHATEARIRGLEAQAATERAGREAAEREAKRVETETLAVMREKGITDKMIAQAHIDDQSPEGRLAKMEAELRAANEREAKRERDALARVAHSEQQRRQAIYLESATAKVGAEPKYPWIAAHAAVDPRGVIKYALDLVERAVAKGEQPTDEDLLETQEWFYSQAAARAAPKAADDPPAVVPPAARPPARKPATASLTGRNVPPPAVAKTFGQMTRDEQLAHMAAQLKKTGIEV
jgi:hypothetical protein